MFLRHLVVGDIETNCYLFGADDTTDCAVVDPGDDADMIIYMAQSSNKNISAILLTHGHFDHIGAVSTLREKFGVKVYALKDEEVVLTDPGVNLSMYHGAAYKEHADVYLKDGDSIDVAGCNVKILATPGHTIGSACYYIEKENVLFSGDTLFQQSVGRTDFSTSSSTMLVRSIHEKLFTLPSETLVYTGHGPETDIGYEKKYNFYV